MTDEKIMLALVHNKDSKRLIQILPKLKKLNSALRREGYRVELFESSWQPSLQSVKLGVGIYREWMYWKLKREWNRYKFVKNRFLPYDLLRLIIKLLYKNPSKINSKKWLINSAIEMFVSNKHLFIFDLAIEKKVDYLIVFEDDAIFKNDSISRVIELLGLIRKHKDEPGYIDLAGGLNLEGLKMERLISKRGEGKVFYSRPLTNTACSYLINKTQLETINNTLVGRPWLRYIGIDWLLNKIFIIQSKELFNSFCIHTVPPIFGHGSVTGEFNPWER